MEKRVQFSVFLANKPGVLAQIFQELGKAKVNIAALAMMDSVEHGVLRLIVDDPPATRDILKKLNAAVKESEVLAVTLSNRPGAAADLCDKLSSAHMNIRYMYCTGGARGGKTLVVLSVSQIKKAMKLLEDINKDGRRDMKIKLRRPMTKKKR